MARLREAARAMRSDIARMTKKVIPASLITLAFTLFLGNAPAPDAKTWSAKGTLTDACQCAVYCACEFNGKPTAGHCDDASLVQITKGHFGNVTLDGKRFVVVAQSPHGERMVDSVGRLTFAHIYVESNTTDAEMNALAAVARKMLGTFVNGADRISANETVERVPIAASVDGNKHSFSIPNVLDLQMELMLGADKKTPMSIANHIFNEYGFTDPQIGRSSKYTFNDGKHKWDYSERSASLRTFDMQGAI